MVGYHPCSVLTCDDRKSTRHRFPMPEKDPVRFRRWTELTGNSLLLSMEPAKVYRSYRVCHRHFSADTYASNMYLVKTALPTLYLPAPSKYIINSENLKHSDHKALNNNLQLPIIF